MNNYPTRISHPSVFPLRKGGGVGVWVNKAIVLQLMRCCIAKHRRFTRGRVWLIGAWCGYLLSSVALMTSYYRFTVSLYSVVWPSPAVSRSSLWLVSTLSRIGVVLPAIYGALLTGNRHLVGYNAGAATENYSQSICYILYR